MTRGAPRLIVGIGASAGGLQAFRELLSVLPSDDGMAFLLVQHLDPNHESLLSELLVPHSDMDVREATQGDVLRPDTVYVIRPDSALAVRDGRIELTEPTLHRGVRLPVDHLFRSLAREYGARSVGIVLSGAGSDGSSGLRDIKGAGGLTVAQDPESGGQPGMPQSAINTGLVDLVLAIDEIPRALERFADLPPVARIDPSAEAAEAAAAFAEEEDDRVDGAASDDIEGTRLEPSELARLKAMLAAQIDFDLGVYKAGTIERRVLRRMLLSGFDGMEDYLEHLRERPEEQQTLVRDLLISVTNFFRDPEAYRVLRETVVEPLLADLDEQAEVRVWIPGCATGEEAYSIAMTLLDAAEERRKSIQLQIFATDVDQEALAVARAGTYPPSIAEHVSERRLAHYFKPLDGSGYRVRSGLRDLVSFAAHDLTKDPPFSRMNLVCCRNVLIYLTPEAQRHVLGILHFALRPEAHLFLSTSESTGASPELFTTVSKSARLYRKLGNSRTLSIHRGGSTRRRRAARQDESDAERRPAGRLTTSDPARRAVLQAWVPPTLVVSEEGAVVFMHGELSPYLAFPQGDDPRLDFDLMLREEIATRTRGALYRCRRRGNAVTVLSSPDGERPGRVRISARPASSLGAGMVMLSFEEVDVQATSEADAALDGNGTAPADEAVIGELESELMATREDLRNTVEELETSNEELRSSNEESMSMNEELQSANEELEATTEELRSLNEELTTVNGQLREKIEQLEQAHDDLGNFFASARVAMVFLDDRLRIKRFTPAAAELLGIDQGDVGRFTGDIARELLQRDLEEEARAVLEHLTVRSRELHVHDGRWFTRQVLPYRTENRRIEGVVVTLVDVTELKAATELLAVRERQQRVIAQLGLAALRETDPQGFLERTVREVQRTLDLDCSAVLELQPGGERLLMRAGTGWNEGRVGKVSIDTASQAGHTLDASEPVIVEELASETRFAVSALAAEHELTSGLSCTIRDGERAYGVLGGYTRERRAFDDEDADFLQAVANVVGSMINRHQVRLRTTLQEAVGRALVEHSDPDELLGAVQRCLAAELGTDVGEVWWLPDGDGEPLDCRLVHTLSSERRREVEDCLCQRDARVAEDIVARVLGGGRAVWATDIGSPTMFGHDDRARSLGFEAAYAFPIRAGSRTLGVMTLYSRRRPFTNDIFLRSLENVGSAVGETLARVGQERRAERLAAITESSRDAIFSHDPDGVVTEWLTGAERVLGFTAEEMIGEPFERLVPEELRESERAHVARVLAGERVSAFETVRLTRDGERLEVSARHVPLVDGDGIVIGVSSTERDVSRLKETERQLLAADRQKDEFLAMLGHELRNPLSSIRTAAELLKLNGSEDPEIRRTQEILERQSTHMAKLLDGLLDVSRIINGKIQLELDSVDLVDVCREVLEDSRERAAENGLSLDERLPGTPLVVEADRVRLVQVVDNLLSNALRYTQRGGAVRVSLAAEDDEATLRVTDDGVGIEAALLPHVFDVFRQSRQSLDRAEGGLGLGLSLVRSLVELHGGRVEARSEGAGRGSEFVMRLPLSERATPSRHPVTLAAGDDLHVLVVEDNADAADVVVRVLERFGHRVTTAANGRDGIERAFRLRPDVVLCDLGLPDGVTGYDVAKALRERPETGATRLVALSGYGRPEDKARSTESGFDDHLTKPVGVAELRRALAGAGPDATD